MNKLRTAEQAKEWLSEQGISAAEFCRQHKLSPNLMYEILNGRKRCLRGMSHNIAVLLGMKTGVITTHPGRVARAPRNSGASQIGAQA